MNKIICMSGKQYSGKDTVCKLLLEDLHDFKRVGIGDAIKIEYGKKHNLAFDEIEANKGVYRTDLIKLGNWGREQDPDFWLKKIIEMDGNFIVPDLRVRHEANMFKNSGAFIIRVEASFEARSLRGKITNAEDNTECDLDNYQGFDYIISNEYGLEQLKQEIKPLLYEIKKYFNIN